MKRIRVADLPDGALDAADHFGSEHMPAIRDDLERGGDIVLIFDQADHTHVSWRKSVIAGLAREYTPARTNGIAGGDQAARDAALQYLARAPGVTGQYLSLHDGGDAA